MAIGLLFLRADQMAPIERVAVEHLTLGNPAVLTELHGLIAAHGPDTAPIRTTTPWNAEQMPITSMVTRMEGRAVTARRAEIVVAGEPRAAIFLMTDTALRHGALYPGGTAVRDVLAAAPPLDDARAFQALFALQSSVINSLGYLSILKGAEFSKGIDADDAAARTVAQFYRRFAPAFLHFADRPDPRMRAMARAATPYLVLTEAEQAERSALIAGATEALHTALAQVRWQGRPLTRAAFHETLATLPDARSRRDLVAAYSAAVLRAHRHGLFPMIDRLNTMARRHGFANYAAYASVVLYQVPEDHFIALLDDFAAQQDHAVRTLIDSPGSPQVAEWDVHFLARRAHAIPSLTFRDGLAAATAFYRDLGFDLEAAPLAGNVLYDTHARADKYGNAFAARLGDGSQSWFHANFAPEHPITLDNLRTIVHELAHSIHGIIGAQEAEGNGAMGMAAQPLAWREGIARALEGLVMTRAWMDRYLAQLPQFADAAHRAAMARTFDGLRAYDDMLVFLRARFELQLYDDSRPWTERLEAWSTLAERYLHVHSMAGSAGGMVWATPHFATAPCSYVSYSAGYPVALRAVAPIAEALHTADPHALRVGGDRLAHLFRAGAQFATLEEIEAAVE